MLSAKRLACKASRPFLHQDVFCTCGCRSAPSRYHRRRISCTPATNLFRQAWQLQIRLITSPHGKPICWYGALWRYSPGARSQSVKPRTASIRFAWMLCFLFIQFQIHCIWDSKTPCIFYSLYSKIRRMENTTHRKHNDPNRQREKENIYNESTIQSSGSTPNRKCRESKMQRVRNATLRKFVNCLHFGTPETQPSWNTATPGRSARLDRQKFYWLGNPWKLHLLVWRFVVFEPRAQNPDAKV